MTTTRGETGARGVAKACRALPPSADDEGPKEQIIASIRAIRRRLNELGKWHD